VRSRTFATHRGLPIPIHPRVPGDVGPWPRSRSTRSNDIAPRLVRRDSFARSTIMEAVDDHERCAGAARSGPLDSSARQAEEQAVPSKPQNSQETIQNDILKEFHGCAHHLHLIRPAAPSEIEDHPPKHFAYTSQKCRIQFQSPNPSRLSYARQPARTQDLDSAYLRPVRRPGSELLPRPGLAAGLDIDRFAPAAIVFPLVLGANRHDFFMKSQKCAPGAAVVVQALLTAVQSKDRVSLSLPPPRPLPDLGLGSP